VASDAVELVLDLFSTERPLAQARIDSVSDRAWLAIRRLAAEQRLAPLLHWRLTHERRDLVVPDGVREALAVGYREGTFRALRLQAGLLAAARILDERGIPCLALKGAYLAFHAYPEPALRPLRDLDLLVPKKDGLEAFRALEDAGYTQLPGQSVDPVAFADGHKHLPVLRDPAGDLHVELHWSLDDPQLPGADAFAEERVWGRRIERVVAGRALGYLNEADLLLLLVTHTLRTHRFTNGPLVLSDIHYLAAKGTIDWRLFWLQAQGVGWLRGCLLLLRMSELCLGPLPIKSPEGLPPRDPDLDALAAACAPLMFRGWSELGDERLAEELDGKDLSQRARTLLGRVFPSRSHLADLYPVSADSRVVYFYYVPNAVRVAARRAPAVFKRRSKTAADVRTLKDLDQWVEHDPGRRAT
jgi:hypothetical protein